MPTDIADQRLVQFRSDGLGLSPAAYARLLAEIAKTRGIAEDDYSRGGVVAELETRIAALLGKEAAVFMPSGTLANHLALRLLARSGRRVLVQHESHLYNDEGDSAQQLSGLNLLPLADMPELECFLVYPEEMKNVARVQAQSGRGGFWLR